NVAADAGVKGARSQFPVLRLPPLREVAGLVARAGSGLAGTTPVAWEELGIRLAARTVRLAGGLAPDQQPIPAGATARVTRAIRTIERHPDARLTIAALARQAGVGPFHFLRIFQLLTGVTPHQFILRMRLREAAIRLALEPVKILDLAFDCGFGDVSNFNHAFLAEFGVSPRAYRRRAAGESGDSPKTATR
ncbi:MAG: AraC family transcriptional regulator, partial [Thermoanaerobaculia bacterium]